MSRPERYVCQHTFLQPGDGWVEDTVFEAGQGKLRRKYRRVHCRLCRMKRVELWEYGRWKAVEQLEFGWQ